MLWGIAALFTSVKSTLSPCVTRTVGPGTFPSKVHAWYFTLWETWMTVSRMTKRTCTTRLVARGGASGLTGAGAVSVPTGASPCDMFAGDAVGAWCFVVSDCAGGDVDLDVQAARDISRSVG